GATRAAQPRPLTGTGDHVYACWHDWLQPPEGLLWGDTQGLAQDSQGFIYVAHTVHRTSPRAEAIVVFDAAGTFVRAFGEEFRGGAHGLRIRREVDGEFLYLCDTARREFLKLTPAGEIVWRKGYPHEAPSYAAEPLKFIPTNIAFAPDGSFY